jgi:hypothetical protein
MLAMLKALCDHLLIRYNIQMRWQDMAICIILRTGSRADYAARDPYLRPTVLKNLTLTSRSSYEFQARVDDLSRATSCNSRFLMKSYLPHV